jgi:hypothetical protein
MINCALESKRFGEPDQGAAQPSQCGSLIKALLMPG